jgi:hypothetical protein
VNSVLNLRVPLNAGKLASGLSSSAQLHRVSYISVPIREETIIAQVKNSFQYTIKPAHIHPATITAVKIVIIGKCTGIQSYTMIGNKDH